MWHTFGYDAKQSSIFISQKVWSDFGAHIPLVRSFSQGDNFNRLLIGLAAESPLFPGEPIRYHFGFYLIVGTLEKIGLPLDWALNLPSAFGFFLLLIMIYLVALELFNNWKISLLSVIFFLFNGSLAFLNFFKTHPLSINTLNDIMTNSRFPVFGPWDNQEITAFWNLNIYTNQRHLGLSYGITLAIIFFLIMIRLRGKSAESAGDHSLRSTNNIGKIFLLSLLFVSLLFLNFPVFAIAIIFSGWFFLIKKETRIPLVACGIFLIPAWLYLNQIVELPANLIFHPGYLIKSPLTIIAFIKFWFLNLGLHLILIPLGLLFSPKKIRSLFIFPLLILFTLPNIFQFSPDMINNHKFFNFFLIIGNMFSAYFLILFIKKFRHIGLFIGFIVFVGLIISGFIDLFPILNDTKGRVADIKTNEVANWISKNTSPKEIILNSTWFYHPASLAGRPIFSGYPYFTWSYGYDKDTREEIARSIYEANSKNIACNLLIQNNISYIEISHQPEYVKPNLNLWQTFLPDYFDQNISIFSTKKTCLTDFSLQL